MRTGFATLPRGGDWTPKAGHRRRRAAITALAVATLGLGGVLAAVPAGALRASPSHRTPNKAVEALALDSYTVTSTGSLTPVDPRTTPDSAALFNKTGTPLGVTWGQWRVATATSLAKTVTTQRGPATDFKITLGKLIPRGTYSLFYETLQPDSANPVCPTTDRLIELIARHPASQHPAPGSFVADGGGGASFHARVAGNLFAPQSLHVIVIYDFSGKTYGRLPNYGESRDCHRSSFGVDAMRQMIIIQKSP
jgi:hypothetical protein